MNLPGSVEPSIEQDPPKSLAKVDDMHGAPILNSIFLRDTPYVAFFETRQESLMKRTAEFSISDSLKEAAIDLRYLLDREYPRNAALSLVGDRYRLDVRERHGVRRVVFPTAEAKRRRAKLIGRENLKNRILAVDGYNVLITLENALLGRLLLMADDGVIRDTEGISASYKPAWEPKSATRRALNLLMSTLRSAGLRYCFFGFSEAMSGSGLLSEKIRNLLQPWEIPGTSDTLRSVLPELLQHGEVLATANSALMDLCDKVYDLTGDIILRELKLEPLHL